MNNILAVFTDACLAGVLADTGLFCLPNEDLHTIIEYERWRAEWMAGTASLITSDGQRITKRSLARSIRLRRSRVRNPRRIA